MRGMMSWGPIPSLSVCTVQALERHFIPISPGDGDVGLLRILCQREVHAAHDKRDAASGQQNTAFPHHFHHSIVHFKFQRILLCQKLIAAQNADAYAMSMR